MQSVMTVIECQGSGRVRGRAHGEAARDLIHDGLDRWMVSTAMATGGSPEEYLVDFLGRTSFERTIKDHSVDLYEEVVGIAEGANADFRSILAYNLMDEQWSDLLTNEPGCSVVGADSTSSGGPEDEGAVALAQNMDLPEYMNGGQLVLRIIPHDGPETLVLTAAGMIGLTGVTRAGLGVCVNTLLMLPNSQRGLPVAFVVRELLKRKNTEEAAAFLESAPHASGQHYALADRNGVRGFECSSVDIAEVGLIDHVLMHTNHPIATLEVDRKMADRRRVRAGISSSERRLAFLRRTYQSGQGYVGAKIMLADRTVPISVSPTESRRTLTFGAIAIEFLDEPHVEFCLGRPDLEDWVSVAWSGCSAMRVAE